MPGTGCLRDARQRAPQFASRVRAFAPERFFRPIRSECLSKIVPLREAGLRRAVDQYVAHYHAERSHQGLESRLIEPGPEAGRAEGRVLCRSRLGGMLRYDYREAA